MDNVIFSCQHCGRALDKAHGSRQYCSQTCRQYAYLVRKGEKNSMNESIALHSTNMSDIEEQLSIKELKAIIIEQKKMYQVLLEKVKHDIPIAQTNLLTTQTVNYTSIDGVDSSGSAHKDIQTVETDIDQFKSRFLEDLRQMTDDNIWGMDFEEMQQLIQSWYGHEEDSEIREVYELIKCYVHTLIKFSYRHYIPAWHLIQLHSSMCMLQESSFITEMNNEQLFFVELEFMIEKTEKQVSEIDKNDQMICFHLSRTTKLKLLSLINHIGHTIKYTPFRFEKQAPKKRRNTSGLPYMTVINPFRTSYYSR